MQKAPKIRFDGYTEDWEHRKLSELLSFSNGFNGSKDMYGEGIPRSEEHTSELQSQR